MIRFKEFLTEAITKSSLKKLYTDLNKKYFGGQLMDIPISFKSLKNQSATVITRFNPRTNELISISMTVDNSRQWNSQALTAIMLHEMIHVYFSMKGDYHQAHGKEFEAMRKRLKQQSGLEIPRDENASELKVYDKIKPKDLFVILADFGNKKYAMFASKKAYDNFVKDEETKRTKNYKFYMDLYRKSNDENHKEMALKQLKKSSLDVVKERIDLVMSGFVGLKGYKYGNVSTNLYKKYPVKRVLRKISLTNINDAEYEELLKNLKQI